MIFFGTCTNYFPKIALLIMYDVQTLSGSQLPTIGASLSPTMLTTPSPAWLFNFCIYDPCNNLWGATLVTYKSDEFDSCCDDSVLGSTFLGTWLCCSKIGHWCFQVIFIFNIPTIVSFTITILIVMIMLRIITAIIVIIRSRNSNSRILITIIITLTITISLIKFSSSTSPSQLLLPPDWMKWQQS